MWRKEEEELLEEMQQTGLELGMVTYIAAISACVKGKQPDKAWELLERCSRKALALCRVDIMRPA